MSEKTAKIRESQMRRGRFHTSGRFYPLITLRAYDAAGLGTSLKALDLHLTDILMRKML
ncbi:MAG: hypothetical protein ABIH42_06420 [Planctomycetota bacterium]